MWILAQDIQILAVMAVATQWISLVTTHSMEDTAENMLLLI